MGSRDRERLPHVARLRRPGDAEEPVRRVRLVAVLRQPDPLRAVEARQLGDEIVDVAERDTALARRSGRGRLGRSAVVGMMGVGVEAARAAPLHRAEERERRDGRLRPVRVVVAAGRGHAAGDLLAAQHRGAHAVDDRVADPRVVERALDHPARAGPPPLRDQADLQVRLVPRRPVADAREQRPVPAHVRAAVPGRGRVRELTQAGGVARRARGRRAAVRPRRRAEDREDDLDVVPLGLEHDPVVEPPVVGGIVEVGALDRAPPRDAELAAPVEMDAQQLHAELLERRVELRRLVEVGGAAVGDPAPQPGRGGGRRDAQERQCHRRNPAREPSPHAFSIRWQCSKVKRKS